MAGKYSTEYLSQFRQQLIHHFSADELKILCFDLGVDFEELGAGNPSLSLLTLNLITYLARRDQLDSLIRACELARPGVAWRPAEEIPVPPEKGSKQLRVFLCHASHDKALVRELYGKLRASGFSPWLDEEELIAGQDWELEITKAIDASDVILVCLSEESVSKTGFVQKEIRFALDRALEQPEGTIFLIPLKLTPCEIPYRLKPFQWVNYYEEKGYEKLLRALTARLT